MTYLYEYEPHFHELEDDPETAAARTRRNVARSLALDGLRASAAPTASDLVRRAARRP